MDSIYYLARERSALSPRLYGHQHQYHPSLFQQAAALLTERNPENQLKKNRSMIGKPGKTLQGHTAFSEGNEDLNPGITNSPIRIH